MNSFLTFSRLTFSALRCLLIFIPTVGCGAELQDSAPQTQRQMLSGSGKDDAVPWDFFCTAGRGSGVWTKIPVPSNWELQGFGVYNYGRAPQPKPVVEGRYKRSFNVPSSWAKNRVFVVFDGSMTDTGVQINGQSAGEKHQGGFYRFRYEITQLLRFGKPNLIEVNVTDDSNEPTVNQAERQGDYWNFGGIMRPVYLEAYPQEFIERVAIDAKADGKFTINVFPSGVTSANSLEAQIFSLDGTQQGAPFAVKLTGGGQTTAQLQTQLEKPRTWTAETPNLYEVRVRLKQGGTMRHEVRQRFGFRTFEVRKDDGIYLNGRKIVLKGADRHSFWPDSGRTLSPAISDQDIALMKDMNMNAVRMSHYPPDEHFLNRCDEMGLYVLDELAGWHQHYGTEIGRKLVKEMVTRDVNHPAILLWDNGNEGGWNTELDGEFAIYDPQQRHIMHPWAKSGDIDTKHYPSWTKLQELGAAGMVWMPTEFLHGLDDGGGGASLHDYWNFMRNSPTCAGGFIWALVDEGVKRTDENGRIDTKGNLAPDGLMGPHREKEGSFFTVKEIWSPVVVESPDLSGKFDGTLGVENRYHFTDLKDCKFSWELRKFPMLGASAAGFSVASKGTTTAPNVAPGTSGKIKLDLPADWAAADALSVQVSDPNGRELWRWVWPIKTTEKIAAAIIAPDKGQTTATQDAESVTLTSGDSTVRIRKQTGGLMEVKSKGSPFSFKDGPISLGGESKLDQLSVRQQGSDQVVECSYTGVLKVVRWTMHPGGWLTLEYEYAVTGDQPFLGVTFTYPEEKVRDLRWLGNGPYRVYKNRLQGGILNVWQNKANDTVTGRSWNYPEFRGYFANLHWAKILTDEGTISLVFHDEAMFLRFLTPSVVQDGGKAIPAYPPGNISFLNAISAVGSKFSKAEETGPEGGLNRPSGSYHAKVDLRFDKIR